MLLVVSPNLAVDRILTLDKLEVGEVQRTGAVITQPGGKGSNVARVFRQLGGEVALLGFTGRLNSESICDPLNAMGIQVEAIDGYDGESRVCTVILEKGLHRHPTVINEESRTIHASALALLQARFDELLSRAEFVFVTGSLSRGLPEEFYARLIRQATLRGIPTAVDATAAVMRHALEVRPTLAKANLDEMTSVLGPLGRDVLEISNELLQRSNQLASQTIVTLGENGSVLVSGECAWHAVPPRLSNANPIGTGDAFAAAYIKGLMEGRTAEKALVFATAVAASDAATPEPGVIIPDEIASLVSETRSEQIR